MRAYHLPAPTGIDALTLVQADTPGPGRGQVLVRLRAASLNYRDLMIAENRYGWQIKPDLVPVSDGAGEIVELGENVTDWKVGDRVAGIFTQGWLGGEMRDADGATTLGGAIDGVLAEFRLFEATGLVRLPEHLGFEEGACLPCAGVTAWNALFGGRKLIAGQTVLIQGSGGVSLFGLQFACAAGARVIATSSSDAKLERLRAAGAHDTINYKTSPEWQDDVLRLTDGVGVDHVVEVGGAGTLAKSIASTRRGGSVSLIGVLTKGQIDPRPILTRGVMVRGIMVGSRDMFTAMNRAISALQMRPVIDKVFAFEDAGDAYRHLESQAHVGKVVIKIA